MQRTGSNPSGACSIDVALPRLRLTTEMHGLRRQALAHALTSKQRRFNVKIGPSFFFGLGVECKELLNQPNEIKMHGYMAVRTPGATISLPN